MSTDTLILLLKDKLELLDRWLVEHDENREKYPPLTKMAAGIYQAQRIQLSSDRELVASSIQHLTGLDVCLGKCHEEIEELKRGVCNEILNKIEINALKRVVDGLREDFAQELEE